MMASVMFREAPGQGVDVGDAVRDAADAVEAAVSGERNSAQAVAS